MSQEAGKQKRNRSWINERGNASLVYICIHRYLYTYNSLTKEEFEKYLLGGKDEGITDRDRRCLLKHFRKEIFPLTKEQVEWFYNNISTKNVCYCQIAQELKALKL